MVDLGDGNRNTCLIIRLCMVIIEGMQYFCEIAVGFEDPHRE
jgi:hypothetical protein